MTTLRYEVVKTGPKTYYVVNIVSRDFLGLAHSTKRSAQASCDRANLSKENKWAAR